MFCSIPFKQTVTAMVASSFIAGVVTAMPAPLMQNGSSVSVNRGAKGDRLQQMVINRHSQIEAVTPLRRVPLGCDSAFSPIADPARAHIYMRCTA
jgi:hypothetical protein